MSRDPVFNFTVDDMLKGVEREVAMRFRVYPNLINRGKMTLEESQREIALMRAIGANLKGQLPDLFASTGGGKPNPDCFHCTVSQMMLEREKAGQDSGELAGRLLEVVSDVVLSAPPDKQDEMEALFIELLRRVVSEGREQRAQSTH